MNDIRTGRSLVAALLLAIAVAAPVRAAEASPEFVGILAYAASADDAKAIGLDEATHQKLLALIDQREEAALQIALSAKDLTTAQQAAKLAPFVAESEKQGLALLNREQQAKLRQRRLDRIGLSALEESEVAEPLQLSAEQKSQVAELLKQRDAEMSQGGQSHRRLTQALYERRLQALLTHQQRVNWATMSGRPAPPEPPAVAATETPAEATETTDKPSEGKQEEPKAGAKEEAKLVFNFAETPWTDVIDWLSQETGLAKQATTYPDGAFTYSGDQRAYTISEAMDRINSVLLTKGYLLVRRYNMLMLINREELPPDLVELIKEERLNENLGTFELYRCVFQLSKIAPGDIETDVKSLVGPGFKELTVVLPQAQQIVVTETVGNLRLIQQVIHTAEDPAKFAQKLKTIKLKHVLADDILTVARPLLGLGEDELMNEQINIAVDSFRTTLFAVGTEDAMALLESVIEKLEVEPEPGSETEKVELPELRSYPLDGTDPEVVLPIIKTLLAGIPDGRAEVDNVSKKLIVWARPSDHATVEKFMAVLKGNRPKPAVITLQNNDPSLVVSTLNTLLGLDDEENPRPLKLEADSLGMRIYVYGTPDEVEEVRSFVQEIEGPAGGDIFGVESPFRKVPITGSNANKAIEQMMNLWPIVAKNKVREVSPQEIEQRLFEERALHQDQEIPQGDDAPGTILPPRPATPEKAQPAPPAPKASPAPQETRLGRWSARGYVTTQAAGGQAQAPATPAQATPAQATPAQATPAAPTQPAQATPAPGTAEAAPAGSDPPTVNRPGSEIVVSKVSDGIIIASQDLQALSRFETMLRSLAGTMPSDPIANMRFQVYYLKYRPADEALKLLGEILGGSGSSLASDTAGSLFSAVTDSLIPGGNNMMDMFGLGGGGGGGSSSDGLSLQVGTSVDITADRRLNRLFVRGEPDEVEMVEQVLAMIDKDSSIIKVETDGAAHVIPVLYTDAENVAKVVREVFAADLQQQAGGGGGGPGGNEAAQIIQALQRAGGGGRGGRGGGAAGGRGGDEGTAVPKMTLSVDANSNSIVVVANQGLYEKVERLVQDIDFASRRDQEEYIVVPITGVNPTLIQGTLSTILGVQVGTTTSTDTTTNNNNSNNSGGAGGAPAARPTGAPTVSPDQQRQLFQAIQARQAGGGGAPAAIGAPGGTRGGGGPTRGGGATGGGFRRPTGGGGGGRGGRGN
ncbi:MAG: hypothetical protein KDB14_30680 [Planctomycetales bacterium]|nr:hypothetical protein [Planctomycetales bacterium]